MVASGQNQLFPLRGYTAETYGTYAKVMGGRPPSQPRIKPEYTLLFCSWIELAGWFLTPIGYTISRRYAAVFFGLLFRPRKVSPLPLPRWATMVAKHEVKCIRCVHEDGAPCAIYKRPRQMVVMVGSGSSGDSFELKCAEWADVKAGSLDSGVRAQARKRPKNAAIASARASTSFSAPDFELTGDAGS